MQQTLLQVIPRNITRPKRIAKQLLDFYPICKLSTCQTTTAHLFGFKDWHALEEACKSENSKSPGQFDEQLDDEAFSLRRTTQISIICKELGGVDPKADHRRPSETGSDSSLKDLRLKKAGARWSVVFASNVVDEIQATAENTSEAVEYIDFLTAYKAEELRRLPVLVGQWWSTNVPEQPEVGAALTSFKLNPHHSTSLLKFGYYWGILCVHYSSRINWTLAMGVAYMLIDRYGSIFVQQQKEFRNFMQDKSELTEDRLAAAMPTFLKQSVFARHEFFNCYPRDDFADVYSKQPIAFSDKAKESMRILLTPGTREGTWANER